MGRTKVGDLVRGVVSRVSGTIYQFGGIATRLDGVEIAHFFWNINQTHNLDGKMENMLRLSFNHLFVMAFFFSRFHPTSCIKKILKENSNSTGRSDKEKVFG